MPRKKNTNKESKETKGSSFESASLQIRFVDDEPKAKKEKAVEEVKEAEVKAEAVEIVEELPFEELPAEEVAVEAPVEEKVEEVAEEEPKEEEKIEEVPPTPIKPPKYYHVDQFLQTAIPMFGLNNMQARGFKARMQGHQYQTDMQVFVAELKKYLNIQ